MRLNEALRRGYPGPSDAAYRKANVFIRHLREYTDKLTTQEIRTLRGQALSGDIDGAEIGLKKLLDRKGY